MSTTNKSGFKIPDDLFDNPKREAKVEAVQKLANKEPARVITLVKKLINKDNK